MAILKGFPQVSQETSITSDRKPSENALFDCVPASIAACILWYEGKSQWDTSVNPDDLKDAAYGDYYTGGTGADAYTAICKKLGYNLYPVNNASTALAIQKAHELIDAGKPVIFTQQDDYSNNLNFSHVCTFFADGPGNLTCLDPFPVPKGVALQKSDSTWQARLRSTQLWVVEPISISTGDLKMLELTDPMGKYFTDKSATNAPRWHCTNTNVDVAFAHLSYYRKYEGIFGLPLTGEIYLASLPGTAIQIYERAIAIYDPKRSVDNPPVSDSVYLLHIDSGYGQQIIAKPLTTELSNQIAALKAQLAASTDVTALQAKIASYHVAMQNIQHEIAQLAN